MWGRHHAGMSAGVIDVGSNTVRLLVARGGREVLSMREMLRLGADIERFGRIPGAKIARAEEVVAGFADAARQAAADPLEILITSPGRQAANGTELVDALAEAAGCPARILSSHEEARLAFVGALSAASPHTRRTIAMVDVGGGSAQVAVGSRRHGVLWSDSIDLGSQRLTSRMLDADPPGADAIAAARAEAQRYVAGFDPPVPHLGYAVGGTARAIKRIVGSRLDASVLHNVIDYIAAIPGNKLVMRHGVAPERVKTIAAGAVILEALEQRLEVPLKVVRGGVREGALLELVSRHRAAA